MEDGVSSPFSNVTDYSNSTIHGGDNEDDRLRKSVTLAIYVIIIILTIPGNCLVIIYMCKKKTNSNNFSVYATSLAITDLTVGVIDMPLYVVRVLHPDWFLSVPMCIFLKHAVLVPTTVSILLLDSIAYDRYICVTSPLLYHSRFTTFRSVMISIAMWILGFVIWIPYFVGQQFDDVYNVMKLGSCTAAFGYFTLGQSVLAYYLPALFLVVVYILIQRSLRKRTSITESVQTARRNVYTVENELHQAINTGSFIKSDDISREMRRTIDTEQGVAGIQYSADSEPCGRSAKSQATTFSMHIRRNGIGIYPRSTDSMRQTHISVQNRRSFKTISVVVIAFLLCWIPYFIIVPTVALCKSCVSDLIFRTSSFLAYANSAFNPFIYVLTSKSIRSEIRSMFRRRRRSTVN